MRRLIPGTLLTIVLLMPGAGRAQILSRRTPAPSVNATSAAWQGRGEPIFHAGNYYYPTGPNVFFDGHVMVPAGSYDGVPVYVDTTIEPHSQVLIPIGNSLMKPYERRRAGELAGTAGSRTPSFPVDPSGELPWWQPEANSQARVRLPVARVVTEIEPADPARIAPQPRYQPLPAATPLPAPSTEVAAMVVRLDVVRASQPIESEVVIPSDQGIWIEFEGSRWFSSGPAVDHEASRFVSAGSYRGFDVYRETGQSEATIFVRIIADGRLAPYSGR